MQIKPEEEKILQMAAIRKLKALKLAGWERDFIRNAEHQLKSRGLTEKQAMWLEKLKRKYVK
jgi:hypothetical protein